MAVAQHVEELGTSQRPVVPIMPRRTVPTTSWRSAVTSATMSDSSFMTRRARPTTTSPSSVRRPEARSTSCTSSSRSRRAIWADTLDCTVPIVVAAAEKLPVSAMPRSACRCFSSMRPFLVGPACASSLVIRIEQIVSIWWSWLTDRGSRSQNRSQTTGNGTPPPTSGESRRRDRHPPGDPFSFFRDSSLFQDDPALRS